MKVAVGARRRSRSDHRVGLLEVPGLGVPGQRTAWLLLLAISLAHAAAAWGQVGLFWGDQGLWLHEIERFAGGEILYADYYWAYPPLALWLLGTVARAFGSDLSVLWTATATVYLLIFFLYYRLVSVLIPRALSLGVLMSGFALAIAYATVRSAPLPLGLHTPAASMGFLLLLCALLLTLKLLSSIASPGTAVLLGVVCGLCVLTKQDYWPPAVLLVVVGARLLLEAEAGSAATAIVAGFAITVFGGASIVIRQAGWASFVGLLDGFGRVAEHAGRGFPSWERITVELIAMALIGLGLTLCLAGGRVISLARHRRMLAALAAVFIFGCALHVFMSHAAGLGVRRAFATLVDHLQQHLFPLLLPVALLGWVALRWRTFASVTERNTATLLLGVCAAARLRRGFEGIEWFSFLLEVPTYVLVVAWFFADSKPRVYRALNLALMTLVLVGAWTYWDWGLGPLTRRSTRRLRVETLRGVVDMTPNEASNYRWMVETLRRLDPTGARPLFAFGYSGGFNYFLRRVNPSPLPDGFLFSGADPDRVVAQIRQFQPAPILLDTQAYRHRMAPAPELALFQWDLKRRINHFMRVDRRYFEMLLVGCRRVDDVPNGGAGSFTFYDCRR